MEEKIKTLYENINFIGYYCMSHRKYDYVERAKNLFPAVSEFIEWFVAGNQFGIEEELYLQLRDNLIRILKDMETAVREGDRVLLLDALEYGISEYLSMFLPEEYFKELEGNVSERTEI